MMKVQSFRSTSLLDLEILKWDQTLGSFKRDSRHGRVYKK